MVTCDATPPPAQLPPVPHVAGAAGLPLADAYVATLIGLYATEVTIRHAEHACLRELRAKGVLR